MVKTVASKSKAKTAKAPGKKTLRRKLEKTQAMHHKAELRATELRARLERAESRLAKAAESLVSVQALIDALPGIPKSKKAAGRRAGAKSATAAKAAEARHAVEATQPAKATPTVEARPRAKDQNHAAKAADRAAIKKAVSTNEPAAPLVGGADPQA
jgi:hypothetical protein